MADPSIKIIDSHHHLWEYRSDEYGWMDGSMQVLKRDYLPADLTPEMEGTGVFGTVAVQARQTIEETAWLLEQAENHPFIKGVVGWFDLQSADLAARLDQYALHPRLVGSRHVIQDEPEDDFMLRPAFQKGIAALQSYDLVYDLLLFPRHLPYAVQLVSRFPEQRFVLDHLSKPLIKSGRIQPWKDDLQALARMPNVWCKISGMVTEADHHQWKYEDFIPYLDIVLEAFGTERIMLGSDWPVCRLAAPYAEVMKIPLRFTEQLDRKEKERIYRLNAMACYQLEA